MAQQLIRKLRRALVFIEKWIIAISLLSLLTFGLLQIIARNFFDTGFPDLSIISRHLVLFITFTGAALITEQHKHIKIDALCSTMSDLNRVRLARPLLFISGGVCAVFGWYALQFWLDEWHYASSHELLPVLLALILPLGFLLLALHLVLISLTRIDEFKAALKP